MFRKVLSVSILTVLVGGIAACAHAPAAPTSAQDSHKGLIDARFATFNNHDLDGIVKLYSPTAIMTSPAFCSPRQGLEGARQAYGDLFKGYPDIRDEVTGYVVQGDRIAVQFTVHVGQYAVPIADFLTVQDGLITRDDAYFDPHGLHCT